MEKATILVVEDDAIVAKDIQNRLKKWVFPSLQLCLLEKKPLQRQKNISPI